MSMRPTLLERAFELAKSGKFPRVDDIREALIKEGYESVRRHLEGRSITDRLRALSKEARLSQEV